MKRLKPGNNAKEIVSFFISVQVLFKTFTGFELAAL